MDLNFLFQFVRALFKEAWQNKFLSIFGFAIVSFAVLSVGLFWNSKFETSATIYADKQNILKPLLANQAAQAGVINHGKVVKEMMYSPRVLQQVVERVYGMENLENAEQLGSLYSSIRKKLIVANLGTDYIKVSYTGATAQESYEVINTVIDLFIKINAEDQRSESREAFTFIDNQVNQYKDQLVIAEERLKNFIASNLDGSSTAADNDISSLRSQIEELQIRIDEDEVSIAAIKKQLAQETEFSGSKYKTDLFADKLKSLHDRLDSLLLSYTENHPDIVALRYQISDLEKTMQDTAEENRSGPATQEELIVNPLYQELRSRQSLALTDLNAKRKRLSALENLLEKAYERRKRIAARAAEEAELTRDYDVTRDIYEDMLARKEKARLSMTLNVEGQGVTYRIQEPPVPPLTATGIRFVHFVLFGPIAGIFFVFGCIALRIFLDQKVRFMSQLSELNAPILAQIPHARSRLSQRVFKIDIVLCIFLLAFILAGYAGLAVAIKLGLLAL